MNGQSTLENQLFSIKSSQDFDTLALEIFSFQYSHNPIYRKFCEHLGKRPSNVDNTSDIPFLPIRFFKTEKIVSGTEPVSLVFESSRTTGTIPSSHYVISESLYQRSILEGFKRVYGKPSDYVILALLPSYLERGNASLVYMVNYLMQCSGHDEGGFYLDDIVALSKQLQRLEKAGQAVMLIGVSYALLDLAEAYPQSLENTIIMETGGMKGTRPEWIREELHAFLKSKFGVADIHSEYGMTELLSQGYATKNGHFYFPPWVRLSLREVEDPLSIASSSQTGGVNIIDLANLYSCSFIATDDLGKIREDGAVEILGRFDSSDIRGCNLMVK
ncbi:MAG: acyl transferase [Flavobacteriaceae bacterium]|nr:acyl transferase [Flavobacteriaceae bacterium]